MSVLDKVGLNQHLRYVHVFSASISTPSVLFLDVARAQFKTNKKIDSYRYENEISGD
jgi:hypothetical protein